MAERLLSATDADGPDLALVLHDALSPSPSEGRIEWLASLSAQCDPAKILLQYRSAGGASEIADAGLLPLAANRVRRGTLNKVIARACGRIVEEAQFDAEPLEPVAAVNRMVLVAEDNLVNQKVTSQQLKTLGYRCERYDDRAQALNAWREGNYDIVLTDRQCL